MTDVAVEELTAHEQEWINRLATVLATAYGSARGPHALPVRSAVFRGAMSVFDEWIAKHHEDAHDPLYETGKNRIVLALARHRMYLN